MLLIPSWCDEQCLQACRRKEVFVLRFNMHHSLPQLHENKFWIASLRVWSWGSLCATSSSLLFSIMLLFASLSAYFFCVYQQKVVFLLFRMSPSKHSGVNCDIVCLVTSYCFSFISVYVFFYRRYKIQSSPTTVNSSISSKSTMVDWLPREKNTYVVSRPVWLRDAINRFFYKKNMHQP